MLREYHKPVLTKEVLLYLKALRFAHLKNKAKFIDATLGLGGHTEEFVKSGIRVLGIENDPKSLEVAQKRLKKTCPDNHFSVVVPMYQLVLGNFRDIDRIAEDNDFTSVDGILMDLGISSFQLDSPERGFSFQMSDAPLDMRLNEGSQGVTGADLLNALNKGELMELFGTVINNTRESLFLAESVVRYRMLRKIVTVGDFKQIVSESGYQFRKNIALLPFLALRIAVNSELSSLKEALPKAVSLLKNKGRIAVISFHSGEDSIVKNFFREQEVLGFGSVITKKPVVPDSDELLNNTRSRSSKMRVFEKHETLNTQTEL